MNVHHHRPGIDLDVHGLQDGCPRCGDLAENPMAELDGQMLAALAALAVDPERLQKGRSDTELVAAKNVLTTLERVGRLCEAAPSVVEHYLRDRWHLQCRIVGK